MGGGGAQAGDVIPAYALTATTYDLGNVCVANLALHSPSGCCLSCDTPTCVPDCPFAAPPACSDIKFRAIVRHPISLAGGLFPLVLIMPGNHSNCRLNNGSTDVCRGLFNTQGCGINLSPVPTAEGMSYLAETAAAQGAIAASIDVNGINCFQQCVPGRSRLYLEHIRRWTIWNTTGAAPFGTTFAGHVDTMRTALVGHSRGGDAATRVPELLAQSPMAGVRVASLFLIAPSDFATNTFASLRVPASNPASTPLAVIVGSCDGDSLITGLNFYDRNLIGRSSWRAAAHVIGANHNYYNTSWTVPQGSTPAVDNVCSSAANLIGGPAQRALGEAYMASWLGATLAPMSNPPESFVLAEGERSPGIEAAAGRALDVRRSFASHDRLLIDDFEGAGAGTTNRLGLAVTMTGFVSASACSSTGCGATWAHPAKHGARLSWNGGTPRITWQLGGVDGSGYDQLSLRVAQLNNTLNPVGVPQDFRIRLRDSGGRTSEILASDVKIIPFPFTATQAPKDTLLTVRAPLARFQSQNAQLDVMSLASVELEMTAPGHTVGTITVTDIELAGGP